MVGRGDVRSRIDAESPLVGGGHVHPVRPRSVIAALSLLLVSLALAACGTAVGGAVGAAVVEPMQTLLPADAEWRYLSDVPSMKALPGDWTKPDFVDAGWETAVGPFGSADGSPDLGEGYEAATLLPLAQADGAGIPTYLFRADFELTKPELESLEPLYAGELTYDDAVTVYVNGTEVLADNHPEAGYPDFTAFGAELDYDLPLSTRLEVDADLLMEGENVIAVELRQVDAASTDIWFGLDGLEATRTIVSGGRDGTLALGVAEASDAMLVSWQGEGSVGSVAYRAVDPAALDGMEPGEALDPALLDVGTAQRVEARADGGGRPGQTTFQAVIGGLEPGRAYVYQVRDEASSSVFGFEVPECRDGFSFIANGDPQISDADDPLPIDDYVELVGHAAAEADDALPVDFLMTLGDQSNVADDPALFERYLSAGIFRSLPVAPIRGNHEAASDLYERFFPMLFAEEGTISADSGDYWFWRDDALFLCLDSNEEDVAVHERFVRTATIAAEEVHGEPTWIICAFHHAPYSVGDHVEDKSIQARRERLVPMLEAAGVDLVLNGHDHVYTRTYPMQGGRPLTSATARTSAADGPVYLTLGSATGTKYYDHTESDTPYAAFSNPENTPTVARVDVTSAELHVTVYSLGTDGLIAPLDTCAITR